MTSATTSSTHTAPTEDPEKPKEYRLLGSCHCKAIQYAVYVTLPPQPPPTVHRCRIYKCNCTVCQKSSLFHLRLADAPNDFQLFSPLSLAGLGDYVTGGSNGGRLHFYFCKTCGVRCFTFFGTGELHGSNEPDSRGHESEKPYWQPKREGWLEYREFDDEGKEKERTGYLSVNAATLEAGQEGGDLRVWQDRKWLYYIDCLEDEKPGEDRKEYPHSGGMW